MTRTALLLGTLAVTAITASSASAQPLSVTASGRKRLTINNAAGVNQFNWASTAPLMNIEGTAEGVSGSCTLDPKDVSSIRGTLFVQVSTMKTGNATRDGHLLTSNWLDAAKFPTISFTITSVSNVTVVGNKGQGTANGTFTMHGVSKPMSIPFDLTYVDASAQTRARAPGDLMMISAAFTVALADFHVAGAEGMIGSRVGETIRVTTRLFGSSE